MRALRFSPSARPNAAAGGSPKAKRRRRVPAAPLETDWPTATTASVAALATTDDHLAVPVLAHGHLAAAAPIRAVTVVASPSPIVIAIAVPATRPDAQLGTGQHDRTIRAGR